MSQRVERRADKQSILLLSLNTQNDLLIVCLVHKPS